MTEVSTKSVWEVLLNGDSMENLLNDVPDEFYTKIKEYENKLINDFKKIKNEYTWYFYLMSKDDRKEFALTAKETDYPSILFGMLNEKNIDPIIWKIIKPEFKKL
jgi:RNA ligase